MLARTSDIATIRTDPIHRNQGEQMRGTRWVALAAAAAAVAASLALTAGPAAGQSSTTEKPKATEVGVTAKEIHIAIVADVDTPIAPNIFIGGGPPTTLRAAA
jgi:hypothetical protein